MRTPYLFLISLLSLIVSFTTVRPAYAKSSAKATRGTSAAKSTQDKADADSEPESADESEEVNKTKSWLI